MTFIDLRYYHAGVVAIYVELVDYEYEPLMLDYAINSWLEGF